MNGQKRVFLAGLFHETHTFLPGQTDWGEFTVRRGAELLDTAGDGSPMAGVVEFAAESAWTLVPGIDARAAPSSIVAADVLERYWRELSEMLRPALARGLDGLFFVLHGAMAARGCLDVEGELLARVRALPGAEQLPLTGVLDLHGNFSPRMAEHADCFVAYRENPHTDAQAMAIEGARRLDDLMVLGRRAETRVERPAVIWPPTGTGTADAPMRDLEEIARRIERLHPDILAVNVFGGFAFADTPFTGVSFSGSTLGSPLVLRSVLKELSSYAFEHRRQGNVLDPPIDEVMEKVKSIEGGPILLVEPADNVGGGAAGDGTGVLRAMLKFGITNSAVVINDPAAVAQLAEVPIHGTARVAIGGTANPFDEGPVALDVVLKSTSNGQFELEDRNSHLASMLGVHVDMGPCAVVEHAGITVLLTSRKTPPFDLGQWRSQGIAPERLRVIGVKAAVAHRRAYDPIAKASFRVDTPGPCSSDLRRFPYRHVPRPIYPLDQTP